MTSTRKTMRERLQGMLAASMAAVLAVGMMPAITTTAWADEISAVPISTQAASYTAELAFSDSGISATSGNSGYKISETQLTINEPGVYRVSGSCSEGNIVVKKGTKGVTLVLDGLTLACSTTAPIAVNKTAEATIELPGGSTTKLTDAEDPDNENSEDEDVKDAFEGAGIKVKSGSSATFTGDGTLIVDGSNCKNGIKGGATAFITFESGTYEVTAANNGIAADGSVAISGGTFDIDAGNEGIKSDPDDGDEDSAGTIGISGGTFDITAAGDAIQAAGDVTISDGVFTLAPTCDGVQSSGNLSVTGGAFDITACGGYNSTSFNGDTSSAKGLKVSVSDDEGADASSATNTLAISGGDFKLNTADDAVHSDAYITVTGGTFDIKTGDDGMHADTSLILGEEGGDDSAVNVKIANSYEGLEGGTVYLLSGTYDVVASDDGVNAAGGSGSGSNPSKGGGNGFNPGGGGPGGWQPGQGGGRIGAMSAEGAESAEASGAALATAAAGATGYNIYVYGGDLSVNCDGDGLDSNGGLYLYGGKQQVYSMSRGDNSAIDADGTVLVKGATIFTAGATGMDGAAQASWFGDGQEYVAASGSYSKGAVLTASAGSTALGSYTLPKAASYVMFSAPSTSALTLTTGSGGSAVTGSDDGGSGNATAPGAGNGTLPGNGMRPGTGAPGIPASESNANPNENAAGNSNAEANAEFNDGSTANDATNQVDSTSSADEKAGNPMTVKTNAKSFKAAALAKAKKTVKAITVKNAEGKVTYSKASGSKYLSVNKNTGKVTVAKGTPAGTYKIKVKVKAAGNDAYDSTAKAVTVKVKVK